MGGTVKIWDLEDRSKHFVRTPTTREYNESKWYAARLEMHTKLGYVEKVEWSTSYLIPSLYCTKVKIGFQAVLPLCAFIEVNKGRCTIRSIARYWMDNRTRGLAMRTAGGSVTWHRNLEPNRLYCHRVFSHARSLLFTFDNGRRESGSMIF